VLQRATKPAKELIAQNPSQDDFQTRATSGLVFARQAAAADVAGGDIRWQQAGNRSKELQIIQDLPIGFPINNIIFQGSRARDTTKCVTRCKNGEKCEVCVFSCYGTQSHAASNRRTVNSKSSMPELALLLSARSPVSPAAFLIRQKWREMRNARFPLLWHWVARGKQQEKH